MIAATPRHHHIPTWAGALLLTLALSSPVSARVGELVDGRYGHQVKELSHLVRANVHGLLVETTVTRSLRSTSGSPEEAIVRFRTPPGSVVVGLWLKVGARWVKGALLDAAGVRRSIQNTRGLPPRYDPAWLEQTGANRYRLRVYPTPPKGAVRVRYRYVHPVTLRWGRRVYVYPRRGTARNLAIASVRIVDHPALGGRTRTHRLRLAPKTTLERLLTDPPIPSSRPVRAALFVSRGRPLGRRRSSGHALLLVQGNPGASRRRWGTDVVFLIDRSRSMWRDSHLTAGAIVRSVLSTLGQRTRFALVAFHRRARRVTRGLTWASPTAVRRARASLSKVPLANGTSLSAGLAVAYRLWSRRPSARRRLLVILTDGLLGEHESAASSWPTAPRGTEILLLQGRPFAGVTEQLHLGALASLATSRGGVAYAFDPHARDDGTPAGEKASRKAVAQLAGSLARPGRLRDIRLHLGGKRIWLPRKGLALLGGLLLHRELTGAIPTQATLSFGYWGKRRTLRIPARPMPGGWADRLSTLYGTSLDRGVNEKRSLIVVHPADAFGQDRLRFARRWGGRFFLRMSPPGALNLPVGPFFRPRPVARAPARSSRRSAGQLTKGMVRRLFAGIYLKAATRCYQATGPRFKKGRAVLYLDLTRGEVTRAWLAHSTVKLRSLRRCLIRAAYGLRIPRSWGDETLYRVTYPMRFAPSTRSATLLRHWRPPPKRPDPNPLRGLW